LRRHDLSRDYSRTSTVWCQFFVFGGGGGRIECVIRRLAFSFSFFCLGEEIPGDGLDGGKRACGGDYRCVFSKEAYKWLQYQKEPLKRQISQLEAAKPIGSPSALSAGGINGNHIRSDALRSTD
jgi:hypothetical protein